MSLKRILIFLLVCLSIFAQDFYSLSLEIINIPFPPYQSNVVKLFEFQESIYGIVASSKYNQGKIFSIEKDGKILIRTSLPDDVIQVDSVIFNPDLSWTWSKDYSRIITLDNTGLLKIYEKNGKEIELLKIAGTRPYEPQVYQISRSFAIDKKGFIYTAGKDGLLFRIDPESRKVEKLKVKLPSIKGRDAWASLDAATTADDGSLYLGTYDGYLARFDPEKETIVNLGKPLRQQRIQALLFYKDIIFGIAGEPDGLARWFMYDPRLGGFHLGGTLKDARNKLIYEPVNTCIVCKDGTILGSYSGRLGSLFRIKIESKK